MVMRFVAACAAALWAIAFGWATAAQELADIPLDHPAIQYAQASTDPVATLLRRPDGVERLTAQGRSGHLRSLLDALGISPESQILRFARGSVQSTLITPGNPRALYFNDSTVVGWVRGGFVEIAAQDPVRGTIFYSANTDWLNRFTVTRSDTCLSCHFTYRTGGVPGMIEPMGHTRPLDQRWGGWYVTGSLGRIQHFGNVDPATILTAPDTHAADIVSLEKTFDVDGYLTPYSDVPALMVFEHQMQMMNLLTRVGWEARVGKAEEASVRQLVDYMLFVDEAPISSRIEGSSGFARLFSGRGPRDSKGRSLYQLDLSTRLLRFPCSYMIYSAQFEMLPADAKTAVYRRLWDVLSGADNDVRYKRLPPADRRTIVEILRETRKDLPGYFSQK